MGNGWPSYSPDGKKIVYQGWDGHDFELYTINAGSGGRFQVTHNNGDDFTPSYSPDGKKIIYMSFPPPNSRIYESEIYMINIGGGGKVQLTNNNKDDLWPSYSPDGKKFAYTSADRNHIWQIYTKNVGGGGKVQLRAKPSGKALEGRRGLVASALLLVSIQPSAWKANSANFAGTEF